VSDGEARGPDPVGSVAEEAVKLLGALQGWAQGTGDLGSATAGLLHELDEHLATGGADCRYCPVCQVISAVRETSPEVKEHLITGATSLLQAAAGVLQARGNASGADRRGPVEKIDLDDDTEWED